jgi:hypothetical protein
MRQTTPSIVFSGNSASQIVVPGRVIEDSPLVKRGALTSKIPLALLENSSEFAPFLYALSFVENNRIRRSRQPAFQGGLFGAGSISHPFVAWYPRRASVGVC